jgi:hypothetical protein
MEYTIENINALISSINSNIVTMKDMICRVKDDCVLLNNKLDKYASEQINLTSEQMRAYSSYINEYQKIKKGIIDSKELLEIHQPVKMLSDISSIISFCSNLLNIHHNQLEIIDRLCALIETSDSVIGLIA